MLPGDKKNFLKAFQDFLMFGEEPDIITRIIKAEAQPSVIMPAVKLHISDAVSEEKNSNLHPTNEEKFNQEKQQTDSKKLTSFTLKKRRHPSSSHS